MLLPKPVPRASGRHGRNLKWLTLKEIRASYLKGEALIKDGWPVGYFIEKMQKALSHEQITYERSKKTHGDRWDYSHYTKEIKAVISKAEAEVVDLMVARAESGKLVLAGRTHPDGVEEIIPRRLWAFLHLDVENGVACGLRKGVDITFRDLRGVFWRQIPNDHPILDLIRAAEKPPETPAPPRQLRANDEQRQDVIGTNIEKTEALIIEDDCVEPLEIDMLRGPGRPSPKKLILDEHYRRRAEGKHEKTQRSEARALCRWHLRKNPKAPTATLETVEKYLREEGVYQTEPC